ncbi:serine/threonine protein kinase, STE, PAK/STE20 [Purpureocillium takamizusanense]|uniref:non-specific serine/threonine protein kinase n=1 Tax=Purpureocillium takamizusanense TaxID=2060973 RepID=A0A9Q8Q8Z3_9HYPO|nr:serine/threonine protein kinase, STE, PAK/STE20 [Purpureocillium takamizusanense]UNI14641.1 serine/threonine protein kinase, STE, PAK/STE20 [Purpureocillium takamizusanense]
MASLQVRWPEMSGTKQRALEDAKKMQKAVAEECAKSGREPPQYQLSELIGKGSFGRVYKATSQTSGELVAVKIIDIEESDTANPKLTDTYGDLLKEINALKLLSDSGAKNVNQVIEALPVGHSMWMITEYCAGGSVATLMRPTAPGGLQEKWIIPILREVAEAMYWVHRQGVIHRDLKCANVLVTEAGDVQLCDFGVAGVIETKFDKRSTFIGTPHWMAPELFDQSTSYGTEIDIWAFGAMVYEIASGLPPNVTDYIDPTRLGNHLKQQTPRLEGDQYSAGLKDLVAYSLQPDPAKRPTIEQVQRHPYIFKTDEAYPTSTLRHLVRAFKLWEAQGGDRRSLFAPGGAQGLSGDVSSTALANDEWSFSTTAAFDQQVLHDGGAQDVYDVYGSNVDFSQPPFEETSRPPKGKGRRRPPPHLPSVKAPLEKVFDPNTISNYEDNSRAYYGRPFMAPVSDLPLRDESAPAADVRESLIDLDASLHGSDLSQFVDMDTIKAGDPRASTDYDFGDASHYVKAPLSDPADVNNNRRTQDWKFPAMAPPASANPEMFRFPFTDEPSSTPDTGRPPLLHQQTEPLQNSMVFGDLASSKPSSVSRASVGSLIDLDMSFPDSATDYTRPSTSHSDVGSISGSEMGGAFELEKHASLYVTSNTVREPSIYVSDDSEYATAFADARSGHTSDGERSQHQLDTNEQQSANDTRPYSLSDFADMDPESMSPPPTAAPRMAKFPPPFQEQSQDLQERSPDESQSQSRSHSQSQGQSHEQGPGQFRETSPSNYAPLPRLPFAPTPAVMEGRASSEEVKHELRRMAMSLGDHLSHANAYLSALPIRPGGSATRLETVGDGD